MGRPRTFEESAVVEAARQCFWATGYHGTSVGDLAEATGLGKGSLYGAFGDKHGLFMRVLDEYCADASRAASERLVGADDEALDRAHAWLLETARSATTRGCLLAKGSAELSDVDPEVADCVWQAFDTLLATCVALMQQAQRAGHLAPGADPSALGAVLLTTQRGLEALGKAGVAPDVLVSAADAAIAGMGRSGLPG